ncbi:MAG: tyrosine-type recombinase/integrase [Clostridia bacterium]
MPIKGSSQGFVYFNKQRKRWNAQYTEYNVKTGKIQKKTKSFKTEEEAKKYLATVMYQKENPIYIEHNGIPICEVMKANLKLKLDTNQITPTQFGRVSKTIEKIEQVPLGKKNIDIITSDEIQEYLNSQTYLSNSSIKKLYQQFNQAFKIAINRGYLMQNPMINVIRPKSEKEDKEVRALTVEEQQAFTEYLLNKDVSQCKYKNIYLIQMYMGLRVSEALAITTHDIDLQHKKININKTLTTDEVGGVIMGNKTKTYAGKRILPIPDFLYPYIVEQMKVANNQVNNDEKLLFKPINQKYTRRENVNSELKRILKKYFNITDISTHSLRHTFGTRCIESGMAPVVVQKLMGHKDIGVTLNTYTSVFDKFKEHEIDKVNKYYLDENLISNSIENNNQKQIEER